MQKGEREAIPYSLLPLYMLPLQKKSFKELHVVIVRAEKARVAEDGEELPDQGVKHKTH